MLSRKRVQFGCSVLLAMAVGLFLFLISCGLMLPRSGQCILFVTVMNPNHGPGQEIPPFRMDVLANGKQIASFANEAKHEWRIERVLFDAMGRTTFAFRFVGDDGAVLCSAGGVANTTAGGMFEFQWMAASPGTSQKSDWAALRRAWFGPAPDAFAAPVNSGGKFPGLWCWFRPANAQEGHFQIDLLVDESSLDAFKRRAWWKGLSVTSAEACGKSGRIGPPVLGSRPAYPDGDRLTHWRLVVGCPKGQVVDAMLEVEKWPGVKNTHTLVQYVY